MRRFAVLLILLVAGLAHADPIPATQVLRLGPLPAPPAGDLDARVRATEETVTEIDPRGWLPGTGGDGEQAWSRVNTSDGAVALADPGVWWLAARLNSDRWAEVTVTAGEDVDAEIWVDGELADGAVALPAGACFVFARVVACEGGEAVSLIAEADTVATLTWDLADAGGEELRRHRWPLLLLPPSPIITPSCESVLPR